MKHRILVVIVLALAGCGGSIAPGGADANPSAAASTTATVRPATATPAPLDCGPELTDFVDQLAELDSRLTIGLNFADYTTHVSDAVVAHDRIPAEDLSLACLDIGVDAENALKAYADAHDTWNTCIDDAACSNDSITPQLQAKWAEATDLIDTAKKALR